ncbi:hypothetical protein ACHWQZ_G008897 [Mnemiopsis leidyi]
MSLDEAWREEMVAPEDYGKIFVGISCLCFILVFGAILLCMTDYKLCFRQNNAQKIFHDSVLENVAAVKRDQERVVMERAAKNRNSTGSKRSSEASMGRKRNKTHPASDGISDDTITLDNELVSNNKPRNNGTIHSDPGYSIVDQDKIEIDGTLIVSALQEDKMKTCRIEKHHSSDEINAMPV